MTEADNLLQAAPPERNLINKSNVRRADGTSQRTGSALTRRRAACHSDLIPVSLKHLFIASAFLPVRVKCAQTTVTVSSAMASATTLLMKTRTDCRLF